jgi:hypothetical protein
MKQPGVRKLRNTQQEDASEFSMSCHHVTIQ